MKLMLYALVALCLGVVSLISSTDDAPAVGTPPALAVASPDRTAAGTQEAR